MSTTQKLYSIWITILQKLGLTPKSNNLLHGVDISDSLKRKGHTLVSPTPQQLHAIKNNLVKKSRIEQWEIQDNASIYELETKFLIKENPGIKPWPKRSLSNIDHIIIGSTNSYNMDAKQLFKAQTSGDEVLSSDKKFPGHRFHVFINSSGVIERVSRYENIVNHTPGINQRSVAVFIQYNPLANNSAPSKKVLSSLERVLTLLCLQFRLDPYKAISGQSDILLSKLTFGEKGSMLKNSPGQLINLETLKWEIAITMQRKLKYAELYRGPINGKFTKEMKEALNKFNSNMIDLLYTEVNILDVGN